MIPFLPSADYASSALLLSISKKCIRCPLSVFCAGNLDKSTFVLAASFPLGSINQNHQGVLLIKSNRYEFQPLSGVPEQVQRNLVVKTLRAVHGVHSPFRYI